MKILLQRAWTGWLVSCGNFTAKHSDLAQAAWSALALAEKHPGSTIELDPEVPRAALDRARRARDRANQAAE